VGFDRTAGQFKRMELKKDFSETFNKKEFIDPMTVEEECEIKRVLGSCALFTATMAHAGPKHGVQDQLRPVVFLSLAWRGREGGSQYEGDKQWYPLLFILGNIYELESKEYMKGIIDYMIKIGTPESVLSNISWYKNGSMYNKFRIHLKSNYRKEVVKLIPTAHKLKKMKIQVVREVS